MPRRFALITLLLLLCLAGIFAVARWGGALDKKGAEAHAEARWANRQTQSASEDGRRTNQDALTPSNGNRNAACNPQPTPDREPPKTAEDSNGPPLKPAAPPKPADLPIGNPEAVKPPQLSAKGKTEQFQAWVAAPELKARFRGQNPMWRADAGKTRHVHGHVYEVREALRVPLEGVEVLEAFANQRTFTDANGRFEFEPKAVCSEQNPSDYEVNLIARASGYILLNKARQLVGRSKDVGTDEGVPVFMTRVENETVHFKITNPELARGELTVTMARFWADRIGNDFFDDRMAIATVADERGEAWFSVPQDSLTLQGVLGDGARMDWSGDPKPKKVEGGRFWEVTLVRCDNYLMSGTVTDLRTGTPLKNTLIKGLEHSELTLTDDGGRFSLWVSVDPQQYITVHSFHYTVHIFHPDPFNHPGNGAGTVTPVPGENRAGPWSIALRPWVKASLQVSREGYSPLSSDQLTWLASLNESLPGLPRYARLDVNGSFVFDRVPWGLTQFRLDSTRNGQRDLTILEVPEADWRGEGPWTLTAAVK